VDTHVDYLLAGELPAKYKPQVHFSMAVTGIRAWFFMSYFPGLNPLILKVQWGEYTDAMQIAALNLANEYQAEAKRIIDLILPKGGSSHE
jgi:hypothetical protein